LHTSQPLHIQPTTTNRQTIASRALYGHLTAWLDRYESEQQEEAAKKLLHGGGLGSSSSAGSSSVSLDSSSGASLGGLGSSSSSATLSSGTSVPSLLSAAKASSSGGGGSANGSSSSWVQGAEGEEKEEEQEECGICLDAAPCLSLHPCRHTVCAGCVRGMLKATAAPVPVPCPFCRQTIGGVARAPGRGRCC
jgi:hypothetical protein